MFVVVKKCPLTVTFVSTNCYSPAKDRSEYIQTTHCIVSNTNLGHYHNNIAVIKPDT